MEANNNSNMGEVNIITNKRNMVDKGLNHMGKANNNSIIIIRVKRRSRGISRISISSSLLISHMVNREDMVSHHRSNSMDGVLRMIRIKTKEVHLNNLLEPPSIMDKLAITTVQQERKLCHLT